MSDELNYDLMLELEPRELAIEKPFRSFGPQWVALIPSVPSYTDPGVAASGENSQRRATRWR